MPATDWDEEAEKGVHDLVPRYSHAVNLKTTQQEEDKRFNRLNDFATVGFCKSVVLLKTNLVFAIINRGRRPH